MVIGNSSRFPVYSKLEREKEKDSREKNHYAGETKVMHDCRECRLDDARARVRVPEQVFQFPIPHILIIFLTEGTPDVYICGITR